MKRRFPLLLLGALTLWATPAVAQDEEMAAMMEAWQKAGQPGLHHQHLAALVGSWEAETKFWPAAGAEPMVSPATMEYRMIMKGRYLEEIISSDFMGQPFKGRGLYAFNNVTGELQAIWIDDTSTGIYTYSGSMNEAGNELTFEGKYMDPATKEWTYSRSVMRIAPDKLHVEGWEKTKAGERKIMEITGKRKGS